MLQCDCGFEARAENERELIVQVRRHAWESHGMALSSEQALLLAFRAELNQTAPRRKSVPEAADGLSEDGSLKGKEKK